VDAVLGLKAGGIEKSFRTSRGTVDVLASLSLDLPGGEWLTCLGPSGCGKTTLLRIFAGLLEPDAGTAVIGNAVGPRLGQSAYLPQEDTLLPWRTALDNALLPAEIDGRPRAEARSAALSLFDRFGLRGFEALYPSQLSGGMRQRVGLARTFLARRDLLLLDEPLGALDPLTRAALQSWLLEVWTEFRRTILLVTHDVEEALLLSDRIVLFTPRPARVRDMVSLTNWPRPRHRTDPRLIAERSRLLGLIAPEVDA
jgi:ABC-type nitrate/sulfonate/bicarbonate transport system ATPase subunit